MNNFKMLIFSMIFVNASMAADFGNAIVSGAGCPTKDIKLVIGKNKMPLKSEFSKKENQSLLRKACNVRIPVKLNKDEKIQISDGVLELDAKVGQGAHAAASLQLQFAENKVGSASNVMLVGGDGKTVLKTKNAESQCGKDAMIGMNYSLSASGKPEVNLSSSDLNFEIKVVSCK